MSIAYGIVAKDGSTKDPGSRNWSSTNPEEGRYVVTFEQGSFDSMPAPVASSVKAKSQQSGQPGNRVLLTITQINQDENGQWFFELAVLKTDGTATNQSFSFVAAADGDGQTFVVSESFELPLPDGGSTVVVDAPEGSSVTGGGYEIDTDSGWSAPSGSGPLEDGSGWRVTFPMVDGMSGTVSAVCLRD